MILVVSTKDNVVSADVGFCIAETKLKEEEIDNNNISIEKSK